MLGTSQCSDIYNTFFVFLDTVLGSLRLYTETCSLYHRRNFIFVSSIFMEYEPVHFDLSSNIPDDFFFPACSVAFSPNAASLR